MRLQTKHERTDGEMKTTNEKIVAMELKRIEVRDLLLAITAAEFQAQENGRTGEKWSKLWNKVFDILYKFDEKNGISTPTKTEL